MSKSRETVRTPTNITTGTNILKLDPGIYSYEDSNASDEQKLAMGFPKAMWHAEITVTGYWADNNKSTGYINIVVRDCNGDTPCIYENLYGWTGWRGWQSYALKSDLDAVKAKQINRYVSAEKNTDTVLSSYENKEENFILQLTSNDTTGTIPTLTGSHLFIIEHFMVGDNNGSAIERAYSTKGKLIAWRFKQWWNKTWTAWENS